MFNKKMGILGVVASAGLLVLAGCGGGEAPLEAATLTVWCPEGDNAAYQKVIDAFVAANPAVSVSISENVAENAVGDRLVADAASCADVMAIADDNVRKAVNANALAPLSSSHVAYAEQYCGEGITDAVSIGGRAYAFPHRADNSYLLIYDSDKLTANDVKSFDNIVKKCAENGWDFCVDIANAWYNPAFFWAGGGEFSPSEDGKTINANFLNQGVIDAVQHISDLYKDYGALINTTGGLVAGLDTAAMNFGGKTAAVIQWNNVEAFEAQKGEGNEDKVVVTTLPTITVNGQEKQLKAFNGFKGMCVNNTVVASGDEAKTRAAYALAQYFVSPEGQQIFFDETGYGVTVKSIIESEAYQSNKFNAALGQMVAAGRTVGQGVSVADQFWTPMGNFGTLITDNARTANQWGTYANCKAAIQGVLGDATGWSLSEQLMDQGAEAFSPPFF